MQNESYIIEKGYDQMYESSLIRSNEGCDFSPSRRKVRKGALSIAKNHLRKKRFGMKLRS